MKFNHRNYPNKMAWWYDERKRQYRFGVSVQSLPEPVTKPHIEYEGLENGDYLRVSSGRWKGYPSLAFQWRADGSDIVDATSPEYQLDGNAGESIDVVISATNAGGTETYTTAPVEIPS